MWTTFDEIRHQESSRAYYMSLWKKSWKNTIYVDSAWTPTPLVDWVYTLHIFFYTSLINFIFVGENCNSLLSGKSSTKKFYSLTFSKPPPHPEMSMRSPVILNHRWYSGGFYGTCYCHQPLIDQFLDSVLSLSPSLEFLVLKSLHHHCNHDGKISIL